MTYGFIDKVVSEKCVDTQRYRYTYHIMYGETKILRVTRNIADHDIPPGGWGNNFKWFSIEKYLMEKMMLERYENYSFWKYPKLTIPKLKKIAKKIQKSREKKQ